MELCQQRANHRSPLEPGELLTVGTVTFRAVYESEAFPAAGSAPTVKAVAGEKTVQVTKATTIKAPSKPAPPESTTPDSEPLDFNFEQPLLPVDQEARPTERSGPAPAAAGRCDRGC